jgi:hypothetical protein
MTNFFNILSKVIVGIVTCVLSLWLAISLGKFIIYGEYFSIESNVCVNPGLGDGFVCQGVAASEANGKILVCGYMDDKSNSRIYIVDLETGNYYYVNLTKDGGELYNGHAGGIATTGDYVFIANASKLYVLSLSSLLSTDEGGYIDIGSGIPVNNAASYVYCDETNIYVGEFHHTKDGYFKEHTFDSGNGVVNAIVSQYSLRSIRNYLDGINGNDLEPNRIYAVRDKVQGVCFTPDGKIVFSTSYGRFNSSYFYIYNQADCTDSGETLGGVPVYTLGEYTNKIMAPTMSEDLDWYDGKVITVYESAANKYFFGKLFFADDVNALDINKVK